MLYVSLFMIIIGTVGYDLLEKNFPRGENHFLFLIKAYTIASLILIVLLFITNYNISNMANDFNIQSVLVGISALLVDFGLILAYRRGWKISILNITYTLIVITALLLIDVLFFNKVITSTKLWGIILCSASIFLMNYNQIRKMGGR